MDDFVHNGILLYCDFVTYRHGPNFCLLLDKQIKFKFDP